MSLFRRAGAAVARIFESPADPAAELERVLLYSKDVAGVTQLFARSSDTLIHQITPSQAAGNPLVINPPVNPAALPSVPAITADYDPASVETVVRVTPHVNGSIIGGLVPGIVSAGGTPAQAHGEIRILRNVGPGASIHDANLVILQDNVGSAFPFHLSSRRPSLTLPILGTLMVQYDNPQEKWFVIGSNTEQSAAYPRRCLPAVLAAGNNNDYDPVDATTGMPWWALNHLLLQGGAASVLTGLVPFQPSGSAGGQRFLISNYGAAFSITHQDVASAGANQFICPGGVAFVLRQFASVFINRDEGNAKWLLEGI